MERRGQPAVGLERQLGDARMRLARGDDVEPGRLGEGDEGRVGRERQREQQRLERHVGPAGQRQLDRGRSAERQRRTVAHDRRRLAERRRRARAPDDRAGALEIPGAAREDRRDGDRERGRDGGHGERHRRGEDGLE
jgi:hypothetical protein